MSNIKIWFRHLGISVLGFIVFPAAIFIALAFVPGAQMAGLLFGQFYYSISFYLFGSLLVFFRDRLAPLLPANATDSVAIAVCWLLVGIVIASLQLVVTRFMARRSPRP